MISPPLKPHRLALGSAVVALVTFTGCAEHRIATIEDHYLGGRAVDPGGLSYRPSEVSFDPVVPIRTGPDTIAVLELGHAGDDGTWIAPHYVVVLVRPEGWADQLEPLPESSNGLAPAAGAPSSSTASTSAASVAVAPAQSPSKKPGLADRIPESKPSPASPPSPAAPERIVP